MDAVITASISCDAATVTALLSTPGAQSFINYQNALGFTPLHEAVQYGCLAFTGQLIEARSIVNIQTKDGATPLHLAAALGHLFVIKQLIAARCNVDLQTTVAAELNTALHWRGR